MVSKNTHERLMREILEVALPDEQSASETDIADICSVPLEVANLIRVYSAQLMKHELMYRCKLETAARRAYENIQWVKNYYDMYGGREHHVIEYPTRVWDTIPDLYLKTIRYPILRRSFNFGGKYEKVDYIYWILPRVDVFEEGLLQHAINGGVPYWAKREFVKSRYT